MKIGQIIQAWIDDKSQGRRSPEYLAEKAGDITGSGIRKIISGERRAEPETIIKIAPVLGIPAIRLLITAGYLKESDLIEATGKSSGPIPPDVVAACSDPDMQKLIGVIWKRTRQPCPMDVKHLLHWFLELPLSTQMKIWEDLKK